MGKPEEETPPPTKPPRASTKPGIHKAYRQKPPTTLAQRRLDGQKNKGSKNNNKDPLAQKLAQMRLTIAPIVHATTLVAGPDYPPTQLHLFLLTERQLDRLAAYYSQTSAGSPLAHAYPGTMDWRHPFLDTSDALPAHCKLDELERVKVKGRMFARFIGLRGAETPGWEYERQIEILGNKVAWEVQRAEEEEEGEKRGNVLWGPRGFK